MSSAGGGDGGAGRRDPDRRDLADVYRRTWELELLISGAVVFALLQLPGSADAPWRATAGIWVAFSFLVGLFLVRDVLVRAEVLRLDGYAWFPDLEVPEVTAASSYEDRTAGASLWRPTPTIQSEVVEGPYVRLFVPISAAKLTEVVRSRCPGVEPAHATGLRMVRRPGPEEAAAESAAAKAVLACLEGVLRVELDGSVVGPDLVFHGDAAAGRRGVLAFLPASGLAPGRHTLVIHRLPDEEEGGSGGTARPGGVTAEAGSEPEDERAPWVIPFWR